MTFLFQQKVGMLGLKMHPHNSPSQFSMFMYIQRCLYGHGDELKRKLSASFDILHEILSYTLEHLHL